MIDLARRRVDVPDDRHVCRWLRVDYPTIAFEFHQSNSIVDFVLVTSGERARLGIFHVRLSRSRVKLDCSELEYHVVVEAFEKIPLWTVDMAPFTIIPTTYGRITSNLGARYMRFCKESEIPTQRWNRGECDRKCSLLSFSHHILELHSYTEKIVFSCILRILHLFL